MGLAASSVKGQGWYHLILTTYGAWLPGDERGFRTRRHKEHVEGDYKNPPPAGRYTALKRSARAAMKHDVVMLPPPMRPIVGAALRDRLNGLGGLVACLAVGARHVHVLARMPLGRAKEFRAAAKRHAWFAARDAGWKEKLWGKRGKIVPIKDRRHQLNVFRYIVQHAKQGAWVWRIDRS
ncbi:MAG: hypothetical protein HYS13_03350 [Planctomycetia bacterium]|nr:hypothetical protein [Planctomycetia bacterium]